MKIAMWSGPRNLSTAMMYSFGARQDCAVWDEPFYAAYLKKTGLIHPMNDEILADGETDARKVIDQLTGSNLHDRAYFYQKHMTHHMIKDIDRSWMSNVTNVFLIRHPARVISSYAAKRENPTLDDIGFPQQAEIFDQVRASGQVPIVVDSHDIRDNPEGTLRALCAAIGMPWDAGMLRWPAGGHVDDGVWASHWYGAVHRSTGFAGAEGPLPKLSEDYKNISDQAMRHYEHLAAYKLST
ncbi:sulfotransferase-like domain-containing protein [Cochlodiniinecator piscidefendens]|uniref:sulfotransferase-like domain-containing protein n=1 Tax=Cochlodiniinecator piscidefendens TaxID=2715756 RepID=UPI00197B5E26|nr:HAD family hydrolase [Cochlodiniinecator piscidefendens]